MTKYLNFFESESGFTEAVEAGQLFFPNVSYTEEDDTVHWNLTQPADPVETPMLRMSFSTSTPGQRVRLYRNDSYSGVTAMEIDGAPVNFDSEGYYSIAEPGNHTVVYQFGSPEIPDSMFGSESGAFDTFTSAEITSPVTSIGHHAFYRCSGLSSVSISDSVTVIGSHAFSGCSSLSSVTIPDSVTTIGDGVFSNCQSLQSVVLPDNLTVIKDWDFFGCQSLQSMVLPDSLTAIQSSAFFGCSSLYDINIPSGVTSIGTHAFLNCSGLTAIYLNSVKPPTLGANALDNTNDCPIYVPAASVETYKQACPPGYASRIKTKHRISASVNDEDKGEVMLDQETASEGDTVVFLVNVFDGPRQCQVSVTDGNGNNVQVTDEGDNNYTFTMPASDVTIFVTIGEKPKYNISASVNDDSLGQVNLEQETASEGDHVEFDVEVSDMMQHQVNSVAVTDGNGDAVEYTDDGDEYFHHYSFDMPASDVTISVEIGDKPREKHTVTVNSTDDLVTDVAIINEETGDWDWDYEGELSFPEEDHADFAFRVPDGYLAVSVQASEDWGGSIDEVELNDHGDGVYECFFTMPSCDVSVFITVEADTRPRYNVSASVNDDSLGRVDLLHQDTALLEGDSVYFDVHVFDTDANQITSVTATDGNGDEVRCWWVFDEGDHSRYRIDMPASDVTIFATIEPKQ